MIILSANSYIRPDDFLLLAIKLKIAPGGRKPVDVSQGLMLNVAWR